MNEEVVQAALGQGGAGRLLEALGHLGSGTYYQRWDCPSALQEGHNLWVIPIVLI